MSQRALIIAHICPGEGKTQSQSAFHEMLLLRLLRPDRLPMALAAYIQQHLTLTEEAGDMAAALVAMVTRSSSALTRASGTFIIQPTGSGTSHSDDLPTLSQALSPRDPLSLISTLAEVSIGCSLALCICG